MSLTTADFSEIRTILREEIQLLSGKVEALENDTKEIYGMITGIEKSLLPDSQFQKLSVVRRLIKLHRELITTAKAAGVALTS